MWFEVAPCSSCGIFSSLKCTLDSQCMYEDYIATRRYSIKLSWCGLNYLHDGCAAIAAGEKLVATCSTDITVSLGSRCMCSLAICDATESACNKYPCTPTTLVDYTRLGTAWLLEDVLRVRTAESHLTSVYSSDALSSGSQLTVAARRNSWFGGCWNVEILISLYSLLDLSRNNTYLVCDIVIPHFFFFQGTRFPPQF